MSKLPWRVRPARGAVVEEFRCTLDCAVFLNAPVDNAATSLGAVVKSKPSSESGPGDDENLEAAGAEDLIISGGFALDCKLLSTA